jgi:sugar O-acyltransferase (sialic acid O-acetyltransferase NeuD family)
MRLLVIGAGGHAKVVVSAAVEAGWEIAGIVDESGSRTELMALPVVPDASGIDADAFVIAIGDNRLRAERFAHYQASGMPAAAVLHPRATIDPSATIGPGTVAFAGVVVNAEANIGENVILNTGCTVDHDCAIGAHAHVSPGVNLCGGVTVGEGTLVGVGACAVPLARVGAWAIVGAGSTVIEPVADGVTAVGSPARAL